MDPIAPNSEQDVIRFTPAASSVDFVHLLRQSYWTEQQLEEILPLMIPKATSYELITALTQHTATAKRQLIRLIHVFDSMQERVAASKSKYIAKCLDEIHSLDGKYALGYPMDNAIILLCQKMLSHEIESLSSLRIEAVMHNEEVLASYLSAAIEEEKTAHAILTEIALQSIYFDQAV
ncbi:MAG: DUF892 family protein [Flavobacterium sp.]|nr:DUF892 family protein [Flavobacterium sp.]